MPETGLLGPSSVRRIAAEVGLRPTKQRGQNFVVDANTVRRIVALSRAGAGDTVLEIGPGLGSLTLGLLETGARVVAVEIETSLAGRLEQTVRERLGAEAASRLCVLAGDALQIHALPGMPTAFVANLPYNVSVPVVLRMLELFPQWRHGLVMVQMEVAERLVAAPGSKVYGVPSAKVAWYAEAATQGRVPPQVFWPVPNVDSGLVRLTRRPAPAAAELRPATFRVVDMAFAQRRKMLRAALAPLYGSAAKAAEVVEAAGVDPRLRGETLGIAHFARIAEAGVGCVP